MDNSLISFMSIIYLWQDLSPMQQFYYKKSIFLTGGTGFLGKGKSSSIFYAFEESF
jgi:hypothetical protein